MKTSKGLVLASAVCESILAIPVLGGLLVIGLLWTPLFIMLALHIMTFVICSEENKSKTGSVFGIITSCIAWIPIVGWIMHSVTAIILWITFVNTK